MVFRSAVSRISARRLGETDASDPQFSALGGVDLTASNIGVYLQCLGGSFVNPLGNALNCSGLRVGGSVFLSKAAAPEGASAGNAVASQDLVVSAAKPEPFQSEGVVDFKYAQIVAVMLCQGGASAIARLTR